MSSLNIIHLNRDRQSLDEGTLGWLLIPEVRIDQKIILRKFRTVEKPWAYNVPRESCIPDGHYELVKRKAGRRFYERYKNLWGFEWVPEISGVPGRSAILLHTGNSAADVVGCVAVGYEDKRPGKHAPWVADSVPAYKNIYELLKKLWAKESRLYINIRTEGDFKCIV